MRKTFTVIAAVVALAVTAAPAASASPFDGADQAASVDGWTWDG